MSGHKASFNQEKSNSTQEEVITHVRSCVCFTFDCLRCACVASILRVYLWLERLGLLTVDRGRQPTN